MHRTMYILSNVNGCVYKITICASCFNSVIGKKSLEQQRTMPAMAMHTDSSCLYTEYMGFRHEAPSINRMTAKTCRNKRSTLTHGPRSSMCCCVRPCMHRCGCLLPPKCKNNNISVALAAIADVATFNSTYRQRAQLNVVCVIIMRPWYLFTMINNNNDGVDG